MIVGIGVVLLELSAVVSGFHVSDVVAKEKAHRLQKRNWVSSCDEICARTLLIIV